MQPSCHQQLKWMSLSLKWRRGSIFVCINLMFVASLHMYVLDSLTLSCWIFTFVFTLEVILWWYLCQTEFTIFSMFIYCMDWSLNFVYCSLWKLRLNIVCPHFLIAKKVRPSLLRKSSILMPGFGKTQAVVALTSRLWLRFVFIIYVCMSQIWITNYWNGFGTDLVCLLMCR